MGKEEGILSVSAVESDGSVWREKTQRDRHNNNTAVRGSM